MGQSQSDRGKVSVANIHDAHIFVNLLSIHELIADENTLSLLLKETSEQFKPFEATSESLGELFAPFRTERDLGTLGEELVEELAQLNKTHTSMRPSRFHRLMKLRMLALASIYYDITRSITSWKENERRATCLARAEMQGININSTGSDYADTRDALRARRISILGTRYLVDVVLTLLESVHKVEPDLCSQVVSLIEALFDSIPPLYLYAEADLSLEAAGCATPILDFLMKCILDERGLKTDRQHAIKLLLQISLARGSIHIVLQACQGLLALQHEPVCKGIETVIQSIATISAMNRDEFTPKHTSSSVSDSVDGTERFEGEQKYEDCRYQKEPKFSSAKPLELIEYILNIVDCVGHSRIILGKTTKFSMQTGSVFRPFAVELTAGTFQSLLCISKICWTSIFNASCSDADLDGFMKIFDAVLRILQRHMAELTKVHMKLSDCGVADDFIPQCREMILEIAIREFKEGIVVHDLLASIQARSRKIFTESFSIFFPSAQDQALYLASLLRKHPRSASTTSPLHYQKQNLNRSTIDTVELKLLQLLLTRFEKFGPAHYLMESIFSPSNAGTAAVIDLMSTLMEASVDETMECLSHALRDNSVPCPSGTFHRIELLQSLFFARCADLSIQDPSNGILVLSRYSIQLLESAIGVINVVNECIERKLKQNQCSKFKAFIKGLLDSFLRSSFVVSLVHPLLVTIASLTTNDQGEGQPIMSRVAQLLRASNQLRVYATNFRLRSTKSIRKKAVKCGAEDSLIGCNFVSIPGASSLLVDVQSHPDEKGTLTIFVNCFSQEKREIQLAPEGSECDNINGKTCERRTWGKGSTSLTIPGSSAVFKYQRCHDYPDESPNVSITVSSSIIAHPADWVQDLSLTCAWVISNLAKQYISGSTETHFETKYHAILHGPLLRGGVEDKTVESEALALLSPDPIQLDNEFLNRLIENKGSSKLLIERLERFAPLLIQVPPSVKSHAMTIARGAFAALLKHCNLVDQAIAATLEDDSARPDDILLKLWRLSSEMRPWIATRFGQGYDLSDMVDTAAQRVQFLLRIAPASTCIPSLTLRRQTSGSQTGKPILLRRKNSQAADALRQTLKAMRLLNDDLFMVRTISSSSTCSGGNAVSFGHVYAHPDPEQLTQRALLNFLQGDSASIDVAEIEAAIMTQMRRASLRLAAIDLIHGVLDDLKHQYDLRSLIAEVLAKTFCDRPNAHVMTLIECIGKKGQDLLLGSFYKLVGSLIESSTMADSREALDMISIMNMDMGGQDIEYLHRIKIIPHLHRIFWRDGVKFNWTAKYAAWTLFRLIGYLCSRQFNSDEEPHSVVQLQKVLLDTILHHIKSVLEKPTVSPSDLEGATFLSDSEIIPQNFDSDQQVLSNDWSCFACSFINQAEHDVCGVCNSTRAGMQMWYCPACTFLNRAISTACAMCQNERPADEELKVGESATIGQRETSTSKPEIIEPYLQWDTVVRVDHELSYPSEFGDAACRVQYSHSVEAIQPNCLPWRTAVSASSLDLSLNTVVRFRIIIERFTARLSPTQIIIGIIKTDRDPCNCAGHQMGEFEEAWGYSSSGNKFCSKGSDADPVLVPYGIPYKQGDIIGVCIDSLQRTIEFLINESSQGIAFGLYPSTARGKFYVAVSFTGDTCGDNFSVSFVHHHANNDQRLTIDWEEASKSKGLEDASVAWFQCAATSDDPSRSTCSLPTSEKHGSSAETDLLLNQSLWVLCRCSVSESFQQGLCTTEWVKVVIGIITREASSNHTRILALRLCRSLLPLISPTSCLLQTQLTDPATHQNIGLIEWILRLIGEVSFIDRNYCGSSSKTVFDVSGEASESVSLLRVLLMSERWSSWLGELMEINIRDVIAFLASLDSRESFDKTRLSRSIGALSVLGGWIEPLREGARAVLNRSGNLVEEGIVTKIDRGSELSIQLSTCQGVLKINSGPEAVQISMRLISEVEMLPEILLGIPHISKSIEEIVQKIDGLSNSKCVQQMVTVSTIKRMSTRILEISMEGPIVQGEAWSDRKLSLALNIATKASICKMDCGPEHIQTLSNQHFRLAKLLKETDPDRLCELPLLESQSETDSLQRLDTSDKIVSDGRARQLSGGDLFVFGKSDNGRLGLSSSTAEPIDKPSLLSTFGTRRSIVGISCFSTHVLALTRAGHVWSWGKGDDGRLGHGSRTGEKFPRRIEALVTQTIVQVSAGLNFSAVLDSSGKVWTFGSNANGQIGDGTLTAALNPVCNTGLHKRAKIVRLGCGGAHVLAITNRGRLYSWGKNMYCQLGHGVTPAKGTTPELVEALQDYEIVLVAGGWEHSLAVTAEGKLFSWGAGYESSRPVCGHGGTEKEVVPRRVEALQKHVVVHIAAGWDHSLAICNDGSLWTWGAGTCGMLGQSSTIAIATPTKVQGLLKNEHCVACDGGQDHSVVVTSRGKLFVMGSGIALGGSASNHSPTGQMRDPQVVPFTPPDGAFGWIAVGDKCSFALSVSRPRQVPIRPPPLHSMGLNMCTVASVPFYPRCVLLASGASLSDTSSIYAYFHEVELGDSPGVQRLVNFSSTANKSDARLIDSVIDLSGDSNGHLEGQRLRLNQHKFIEVMLEDLIRSIDEPYFTICGVFSLESSHIASLIGVYGIETFIKVSHGGDGRLEIEYNGMKRFGRSESLFTSGMHNDIQMIHMITLVSRKEALELYVDSEIEIVVPVANFGPICRFKNIKIGPFRGLVRDVGIWCDPLTAGHLGSVLTCGLSFVAIDYNHDKKRDISCRSYDFSYASASKRLWTDFANAKNDFKFCIDTINDDNLHVVPASSTKPICFISSLKFIWKNPWNQPLERFSLLFDVRVCINDTACVDCPEHEPWLHLITSMGESHEPMLSFCRSGKVSSPESSPQGCYPFKFNLWTRIGIVVVRNKLSTDGMSISSLRIYINGDLTLSRPLHDSELHRFVLLPGCLELLRIAESIKNVAELQVGAITVYRSDLSSEQIRSLGNDRNTAALMLPDDLRTITNSIEDMGYPNSWVIHAARASMWNRIDACEWMSLHRSELEAVDKRAGQLEHARRLSWIGFPLKDCIKAMEQAGNDYRRAIPILLNDFKCKGRLELDDDEGCDRDIDILEISDFNSSCVIRESSSLASAHLLTLRESKLTTEYESSEIDSSSGYESAKKFINLNNTLSVLHCRQGIMAQTRNWALNDSKQSFSLFDVHNPIQREQLAMLIRLMRFVGLPGALDALRQGLIKCMISEVAQIQSSTSWDVSSFLTEQFILHTAGIALLPPHDLKIDNEANALERPNSHVALWIVMILMEVVNKDGNQQGAIDRLLSQQIVSMTFEMVLRTRCEEQLSFLSVLTQIIQKGVEISNKKTELLRRRMHQLYERCNQSNSYSSFFHKLLELIVSLDSRKTLTSSISPKYSTFSWYQEIMHARLFMRSLLGKDDVSALDSALSNWIHHTTAKIWKNMENKQAVEIFQIFDLKKDISLLRLVSLSFECESNRTPNSSSAFEDQPSVNIDMSALDPKTIFTRSTNSSKHYLEMTNIPLESVQVRFAMLQEFNRLATNLLPMIDFSLDDDECELGHLIRKCRGIVFYCVKEKLWESVLVRSSSSAGPNPSLTVEIDRFKAVRLQEQNRVDMKGKWSIFGQLFTQINSQPVSNFRLGKGERAWKTLFLGQFADDYGGPYRQCMDDLCCELQTDLLPLFVPCPNRRARVGQNQDKYIPKTSSRQGHHLEMYEFIGKILGIAMRTKSYLNLDWPSIIWKLLVNETVTEDDVLAIDALAFRVLTNLKKASTDPSISPECFGDVVCLTFEVTGSDGTQFELVPDGVNRPITIDTMHEFSAALRKFRLNEFNEQCEAMRRGLATIVPIALLSMFTGDELEQQICGRRFMDITLLQSQTTYEWCSSDDEHIKNFWHVLRHLFSTHEQCEFLKFVWGRSRLPTRASDFDCKFKISNMPKARDQPDKYLPIAHTCFFSLELPRYTSVEIMHNRLSYAIANCVSIDADTTTAAETIANRQIHHNHDDDVDGDTVMNDDDHKE